MGQGFGKVTQTMFSQLNVFPLEIALSYSENDLATRFLQVMACE